MLDKIKSLLTRATKLGVRVNDRPKTSGYTTFNHLYWQQPRDLPPFSFYTVYNMLIDPEVRLALNIRSAPLFGAEWGYKKGGMFYPGVEAKRPEVAAYLLRQHTRIWENHLPDIVEAQKWGWSGGEIILKLGTSGLVEFDRIEPRRAEDCRVLLTDGSPSGVQFSRIKDKGMVDLFFPNCFFHNHEPEAGEFYGTSVLLGAYSPWSDKWLDGGALDVRRLFMHKDAYGSADLGYPDGETYLDGMETPVPNRDIARQIVEQIRSGNVIVRPSERDPNGNEKWPLSRATIPANPQHILQYPKDLDQEIRTGIGIPEQITESTGSWAGARIPMAAFYASLDKWIVRIVNDFSKQLYDHLIMLNWGRAEEYHIGHKPLAEQAMEQQSNAGPGQPGQQPGMPGQAGIAQPDQQPGMGGGMDPQQPPGIDQMMGQPQEGDPMKMSLAAIGSGQASAAAIVAAARSKIRLSSVQDAPKTTIKLSRGNGTPQAPDPFNVFTVPIASLAADGEFQRMSLAETGEWDDDLGGTILVWRDPVDNTDLVVDGLKRLDLAKRSGRTSINVRYITASNERVARARGALANVNDGTWDTGRQAEYLDTVGAGVDHFRRAGIDLNAQRMALTAVDWDEDAHPRGPDGRFIEKGAGTAHQKYFSKLKSLNEAKTHSGHYVSISYNTKRKGWFVTHTTPDHQSTTFDHPFKSSKDAADRAAVVLLQNDKEPAAAPTPKAKKPPKETAKAPRPKPPERTGKNFHYDSLDFFSTGLKSKFKANMEALRVMKAMEAEGRTEATPDEQKALSKFVGWGQFQAMFNYNPHLPNAYREWRDEREELRNLVGSDGLEAAERSVTNSHYTHPSVVKAHWDMARKLGFKGGKFLEPSVGSGYYLGLMPKDLEEKTAISAVEMDKGAAAVAQALYPDANITVSQFQDHKTPNNFYDLVGTNVPFDEKTKPYDPKYKFRPKLHDYFFLRSVDSAKPGGLVMNLTSTGTLDNPDKRVMKHIQDNCEVVACLRFPGDAHKSNAGTSVVTDMLVLRKKNPAIGPALAETPTEAEPKQPGFTGVTVDSLGRLYHWVDGRRVPAPDLSQVVNVPDPDGGEPIPVNKYFADRPEHILGRLDRSGTMYRGDSMNVQRQEDYADHLQRVIDSLPEGALNTTAAASAEADERLEASKGTLEGELVVRDGVVYRAENGSLKPVNVKKKDVDRFTKLVEMRDAARGLLQVQRDGGDAEDARAELNRIYDSFVAEYGSLHTDANRKALRPFDDSHFLLALERWDPSKKIASKADVFTKNTITPRKMATKADTLSEGVGIVLHEHGGIDLDRIAELTGKDLDDIKFELPEAGLAFEDPGHGWKSAAEYLSGNTREKLKIAREAAKLDHRFQANVAALERAQPDDIAVDEIGIKMGSPWVPDDIYSAFASDVLGAYPGQIKVRRVPETDSWEFEIDNRLRKRDTFNNLWGVTNGQKLKGGDDRVYFDFADVLDAAMHGHRLTVRGPKGADDKIGPVLQEQTDEINEKVDKLREQFKDWIWADESRAERLYRHYNDNYNNIVPTVFDGSHLEFPGLSRTDKSGREFNLRPLQKDFVWRVITTGRGLAAHEVGTGKTASMVAGAMELRRLGLAKKPAIVCKKANIEQITAEALELYPGAKILTLDKNFDSKKRKQTMNQIATGDYDMVIMTHQNLGMMRMRPETVQAFIQEELDEITDAIRAAEAEAIEKDEKPENNRIVKNLNKRKSKIEADLKAALAEDKKDSVFFEDSGIDQLFVDEAHAFKTLPCYTRRGNVKGVPSGRSQRATDMFAKTRWLMDKQNGRGVVFATGTPIANTMAELFNMQRYLQYNELKERGLHRFDAWADTYGDTISRLEFKADGSVGQVARFSEFVNLPELRHLASQMMDVKLTDDLKNKDGSPQIIRPKANQKLIASEERKDISSFFNEIASRAEAVKQGGRRNPPIYRGKEDNMLNINNDAKMASIDLRMVDANAVDHPDSKANQAVRQIVDWYHKYPGTAQAVFSDLGVHPRLVQEAEENAKKAETSADGDDDTGGSHLVAARTSFHLFGDMKAKLMAAGIPEHEIVDFSDPDMKGSKKDDVMAKIRAGEIRIAFGSTDRLGTGTNIQAKLRAVHHLDIPYVPAFLEQREGRAVRQGNLNDPTKPKHEQQVEIFKYVQKGSADHRFWQIVNTKNHFIRQYMQGDKLREMKELDTDLTPDEIIAIASGDESKIDRIRAEEEVRKLRKSRQRHTAEQSRLSSRIHSAPDEIERLQKAIDDHQRDVSHLEANKEFALHLHSPESIRWGEHYRAKHPGSTYSERPEAGEALKTAIESASKGIYGTTEIGTYRGLKLSLQPSGMLELEGPSGQSYEAAPSIQSLDAVSRQISRRADAAKSQLANFQADLEKIRSAYGVKFRHQSQLEAAEKRFNELQKAHEEKIAKEKAEAEAAKLQQEPTEDAT